VDFSSVEKEMVRAVEEEVFPGAVLLVNKGGRVLYCRAFGFHSLEPGHSPMGEETVFDLASLTKPLATTVAFMLMVKEKKVRLNDQVTRFLPGFGVQGKTLITFRQLLAHCSGLPAWRPYYQEIAPQTQEGRAGFLGNRRAREFVYSRIQQERLESCPGQKAIYSDIGFMLLGQVIEKVSGTGLDQYCQEKIFRPLGLSHTFFVNLETMRQDNLEPAKEVFAPTESCPWRQRVLCSEVHDDNAYAMGGVAGHAGLFASIQDVDRLVITLVECYQGKNAFLPAGLVHEFWTREGTVPQSTWALGWDTPSETGSSSGRHFSSHSVGHPGFTGTSVWVDLERGTHVILLSNRVHPRRDNNKIQAFRPLIHSLVMEAVLAT
jgi:CubicO group peptidase (beta-lactamase class C family)